ncbi:uncharacterized protein LOC132709275 [Pantherophis guttatus]|uniref:Uncharacterized protein LOC132709275 n=1 Tax=Pantherophis guttatus TaxID=94885 RepID=A0ABM3YQX0_PANGU|nr:uncharacterized protein LOC132709275 [Pantherophis guttatus]
MSFCPHASSSQEQELPKIPVLDAKSVSTQQDLQRKWEETLESLKENYSRIQEEYCNTRHANQLLEEKFQWIVQTMAEERQTWNQRIAELEQLIRFQNFFCVSEKINVSGLLPKSGIQAQPGGENPMGLPSEPLLDVIPPPPPFKDRDSSTQSSPALADLTLESSKLGRSSEFDPARSLGDYEAHGPPVAKSYLHPSPLSAWKPTKFCPECASVTEEEYGRKGRGLVCSPPCFLYLQEASTPSSTASPLPDPELGAFPMLHPPYLSGRPAASEHPAERSRWGRSDPADISRSLGLVEKILRPHLEPHRRPKMLDSCGLTPKRSEQEETPEKGTVRSRLHCVTVHEEGSGEELSSPGETDSEGKLRPRLQHRGAMLPQLSKGGGRKGQNFATVQDSTSL